MNASSCTTLDLEQQGRGLTFWFNEPACRNTLTFERVMGVTRFRPDCTRKWAETDDV